MLKVNTENLVRYKGKWKKKTVVAARLKLIERNKQKPDEEAVEKPRTILRGMRLIDPNEVDKNMTCSKCKKQLAFHNIIAEKSMGFHNIWTLKCDNCSTITKAHSGKSHLNDGRRYYDANTAAVLGAIHSGAGCSALRKIAMCIDMPVMSEEAYKRYEREIGPLIEEAAKDSCRRAAVEERRLVVEHIDKLRDKLPQEISDEIYPLAEFMRPRTDDTTGSDFNDALGRIINIIISYDMGWSKRGNGRSYDSLNGYGAIIGLLSNKILDFATRNRKCKKCDLGYTREDHDCRQNYDGSAKAMEASVGAQLVNRSNILKEVGLNVRVVIGDEDSSTIAAIRRERSEHIFKLADSNHLTKNFSSELYALRSRFSELGGKNVIKHIKTCFAYCCAQNEGKISDLTAALRKLPDHFFGRHENCGEWCQRSFEKNNKHRVQLKNSQLYEQLIKILNKYADNASKFAVRASSQTNESVNSMMARKARKCDCFSLSESCDYRYAACVCSLNDGERYVCDVRKNAQMAPGVYAAELAKRNDAIREARTARAKLPLTKARRKQLRVDRDSLRKKSESAEGIKYKSSCGLELDTDIPYKSYSDPSENKHLKLIPSNYTVVYFDLETSGLSHSADILQIAAKSGNSRFCSYVNPTQVVHARASAVTGLQNVAGELYLHGQKVHSISIKDALAAFREFLIMLEKPCLLVAHNATFDATRLVLALNGHSMIDDFRPVVVGFSDSLPLLKKIYPERKGPGMFKLQKLAEDILNVKANANFHDALYDVEILEQLSLAVIDIDSLFTTCTRLIECLNNCMHNRKVAMALPYLEPLKNVISTGMLKKIASAGITYDRLRDVLKTSGEKGVINLLSERTINKKPLVTDNKRILLAITGFLAKNTT